MTEQAANEVIQEVETEPKIGPGRDLRAAREARNLTLESVAKQLHIDSSLVHALEEDDYSKFAAPIFVTGHIRAYARLLSLAPESLLDAYHGLGLSTAPALERVARLSQQPEPVSKAQVPRWLVYVLALAVIVVVVLVWRSEAGKMLAPILESSSLSEPPVTGNGSGSATASLPVPAHNESQTPAPATSASPAGNAKPQVDTARQASAPAATPTGPQASLDIKAEKPSWVEVKDRSGNRLFYDLMVPGDSKHLEGTPPFDLLLGYAPGVSVTYNGKQVDASAYTHQGMARFRVGDAGVSKN